VERRRRDAALHRSGRFLSLCSVLRSKRSWESCRFTRPGNRYTSQTPVAGKRANLAAIALEKGMLTKRRQNLQEIRQRNKELDDFTYSYRTI